MSLIIQKSLLWAALSVEVALGAGVKDRAEMTADIVERTEQVSKNRPNNTVISAPSGVVAKASGAQIQLSWIASTGGSGTISYDVYRNGAHYAYSAVTSYKDVAVYPNAPYSYQVLAYNSSGVQSALSSAVSGMVTVQDVAAPSQATGYQLVYDDEFNNLDVGQNWKNQFHDWYNSEFGVSKPISPARTAVSNSELSLTWLQGDGQDDSAVASFDVGSRMGRAFRYGYFEASMKWNPVAGAWPAFWLLSINTSSTTGKWGEIDAFEGQGLQPGKLFGTVHDWAALNGVLSQTANNPNYFSLGLANDYSKWHKYGVLWQPGSVTWYFDDNPVLTAPEPLIMQTQDVELILEMAEGIDWNQGNTTGVTSSQLMLNVDWVRVWQRNPATTTISTYGTAFRGQ